MRPRKSCLLLIAGVVVILILRRLLDVELPLPSRNWSVIDLLQNPLCDPIINVGRLNVSMDFMPFDQLAVKWGAQSKSYTWTGESNFTDIGYTLEYLARDGPQSERVVWTPVCRSPPEATAIIIPFRNRFVNLSVFVNHMHPFLRHQHRRYTIYVIDQVTPETFNRAALFNIGYREAVQVANYSCFIFHDVDLLPEDDRMMYACEDQPLHMSATIDKFNYSLFYKTSFGGAVAMTKTHFERTLGYANTYFGWGCEDDDMYRRLIFSKQRLMRRNFTFARYRMMKHFRDAGNGENPRRRQRLKNARKLWKKDTYQHVQYAVRQRTLKYNGLYYYIKADILYPTVEDSRELA
ncbi:Beta-1,4-galactosyltransferase 3 [Sparganum proliferum]